MRCILFGAGGREAIIAEKLAEKYELYAYIDHKNPSIIEIVEKSGGKFIVDKKYDHENIKKFIKENQIELCVVNNDNLLEEGVIDLAKECGLKTFGPTRKGARVEWDKAYAIELIKKVSPQSLVRTVTATSEEQLEKAVDECDGVNFVVKPNGLTGGKGVKVGGEHFLTKEEGFDYAKTCLEGDGQVIIQDKMIGHEFTVMGFTNGNDLVLAPCTYDYPYRYDGDKGAGTGGMGVVTLPNGLLPFLAKEDLEECKIIMEKVLRELNKDGNEFNGVLYGGFFKTAKGIYFIEFNSRLGDPEALNVLSVLETPFAELVENIALGKELNKNNCRFLSVASYVVYVVSKNYATNPKAEPITFSINEDLKNATDINLYCASMEENNEGKYTSVGNSRLFALERTGEDLNTIKSEVDELLKKNVDKAEGLDYRTDIGVTGIQN